MSTNATFVPIDRLTGLLGQMPSNQLDTIQRLHDIGVSDIKCNGSTISFDATTTITLACIGTSHGRFNSQHRRQHVDNDIGTKRHRTSKQTVVSPEVQDLRRAMRVFYREAASAYGEGRIKQCRHEHSPDGCKIILKGGVCPYRHVNYTRVGRNIARLVDSNLWKSVRCSNTETCKFMSAPHLCSFLHIDEEDMYATDNGEDDDVHARSLCCEVIQDVWLAVRALDKSQDTDE